MCLDKGEVKDCKSPNDLTVVRSLDVSTAGSKSFGSEFTANINVLTPRSLNGCTASTTLVAPGPSKDNNYMIN